MYIQMLALLYVKIKIQARGTLERLINVTKVEGAKIKNSIDILLLD